MTAINISSDIATSFTTVSDIFIDQYMPKANGEFVKVYLYLLRATGSGAGIATISEIADHSAILKPTSYVPQLLGL
mgnify:CR=1 FL=1